MLDEAQFVKNGASKANAAARDIRAPFRLAVTGTPVENNLMELWALMKIVAPGLFPSARAFAERYRRPIENDHNTERLARLRRRIRPLVLRRTKELVAPELPEKQEQVLTVALDPSHRRIYDTFLQRERQKLLGLIDDLDRNRFTVFRSLTLLRMLSLHAGLIDGEQYADVPSAKLDALFEQLDEVIAEGHRALVFSQFTSFLQLAAARLDAAGVPYAYLDGSTRRRSEVIDRFRDGSAPVFLISLKAGGIRPEPHRGRLRVPARPVVEPRERSPGGRPRPPHRPGEDRDGLPHGRRGHHRREGHGPEGQEGRARVVADGR